jgi:arginine utilization regulatory protein
MLLRVLQEKRVRRVGAAAERHVNCRILSASNGDVRLGGEAVMTNKQIRRDLLYRLSSGVVSIPPLKERKDDILVLFRHFLRKHRNDENSNIREISPGLLERFRNYDWPGNVRELENVLRICLVMADPRERVLTPEHIPAHLRNIFSKKSEEPNYLTTGLSDAMDNFEKRLLTEVILRHDGNISNSAAALKISRQNLYYKMEKHGLSRLFKRPGKEDDNPDMS